MNYKVIGPCTVAGVRQGGVVTSKQLAEAGANVPALLGVHLEPVAEPLPERPAKPRTRGS